MPPTAICSVRRYLPPTTAPMRESSVMPDSLNHRAEHDLGDLGGGEEAHRRPPETRASAHVDVGVALTPQTGDERLLQVHEVRPGPDLSPVGVPGQLEADAERGRLDHGARLVRQEHKLAARIAPRQRSA